MNILIGVGHGMKGDNNKWREIAAHRNEPFIQRLPYSLELRSAYSVIIQVYAHRDAHSEKFTKWLNALEQRAKQHEDLMGLGLVELWRAIARFKRGNLHDAISHYQKAGELFTEASSPRWCHGWSYNMMGLAFLTQGNLQKAEVCVRRALEIYQSIGYKGILGESYLKLGTILLASSDVQNALEAFHKAVACHQEGKWYGREQWARLALGRAHLAQGERSKMGKQLEKTFDFAKTDAGFLAEVLSCLEETYEDAQRFGAFCRRFRAENPEVATGPFVQWYLQPAEAQNVANIRFQDDFSGHLADQWMWHDPLGDCLLKVQNGLEIHAVNERGLKIPQPVNFSAPRLLQAVTGNFTAQVVCTPVLDEKPAIGGLLLWKNTENFLCLQKGTRGRREISFWGCMGNEDVTVGRGCMPRDASASSTNPVFLRLERHGGIVNALCSTNGVEWFTVGGVDFPVEDPVEIGLHAIGVIDRTIYHGAYPEGTAIRFELFQLWENDNLT